MLCVYVCTRERKMWWNVTKAWNQDCENNNNIKIYIAYLVFFYVQKLKEENVLMRKKWTAKKEYHSHSFFVRCTKENHLVIAHSVSVRTVSTAEEFIKEKKCDITFQIKSKKATFSDKKKKEKMENVETSQNGKSWNDDYKWNEESIKCHPLRIYVCVLA